MGMTTTSGRLAGADVAGAAGAAAGVVIGGALGGGADVSVASAPRAQTASTRLQQKSCRRRTNMGAYIESRPEDAQGAVVGNRGFVSSGGLHGWAQAVFSKPWKKSPTSGRKSCGGASANRPSWRRLKKARAS